jgi:hypothetical protein
MNLRELSSREPLGKQEREIISSLLSGGEDIDSARKLCADSSLGLNLEIVDSILDKIAYLQQDDNFIYVPSINLCVSKERTFYNNNWADCHKHLQGEGSKMLTFLEFIRFLEYSEANLPGLYKQIVETRGPLDAEWLDAAIVHDGVLYVNYGHVLDKNGNITPSFSDPLESFTLMENRPISLEDLMVNHTVNGFPTQTTLRGNISYMHPLKKKVAYFGGASIGNGFGFILPSISISQIGVRAAKQGA